MAEGFGESRHGPRDEPEFGVGPAGDQAGDDVGKTALGDDGVGIGEDGAACVQGGLRGQAAFGGFVGGLGVRSFWGGGRGKGGLDYNWSVRVFNHTAISTVLLI